MTAGDRINELAREVGSLRQQLVNRDRDVERLWGLLQELEWKEDDPPAGSATMRGPYCPCCENLQRAGHSPACRLRRALEELDPNHGRAPL